MATLEGAKHLVRDVNPAFCRLAGKARKDIIGKPFCALLSQNHECGTLLDTVYRTGKAASLLGAEQADPNLISSCVMWPVTANERTIGVVVQVTESTRLHERTVAMNEALLLGSLRQHELTAAAREANVRLQEEIVQRMQSERDALMLTKEISHRIKNNLQVVVALIANEIKQTPAEFAQGYIATEARIAAIAELYDLISQSNQLDKVPLDAYLRELARSMAASLIEPSSAISIEVKTAAVEIDSDRAVPFGLMVNELGTNAIKHAFPDGAGLVTLSIERVGEEIELIVADNGIGMAAEGRSTDTGRHGSDYVAIFVRQLGGRMDASRSGTTGTTIRIRFPLKLTPDDRATAAQPAR